MELPKAMCRAMTKSLLKILPWAILVIWSTLMLLPSTRDAAQELLSKNNEGKPVEIFTALFFLATSVISVKSAFLRRQISGAWTSPAVSLILLAVAALFLGLEEISYGQHMLKFETPELFQEYNRQGELTLHNLKGLQANEGKMYLFFCVAALVGMRHRPTSILSWAYTQKQWDDVRVPSVLLSLTCAILVVAIAKLGIETATVSTEVRSSVRWTTEWVELFIAVWVLYYAVSKLRNIAPA